MKFLIKVQREGLYFSGFAESSGNVEMGKIQKAKIYNSRREAMDDLIKMGHCGQRIVAITQIGCASSNANLPGTGNYRKTSGVDH